jgi:hypothetical protein
VYRTTVGPGPGYQWFQGPTFHFATEAGIAWVHELFQTTGARDFVALRFAYSADWTPVEPLKLYNTLEYLPDLADFGQYLLNIDAGVRATVWEKLRSCSGTSGPSIVTILARNQAGRPPTCATS